MNVDNRTCWECQITFSSKEKFIQHKWQVHERFQSSDSIMHEKSFSEDQENKDYFCCYTHQKKINEKGCPFKNSNECYVFGMKSHYKTYLEETSKYNDHEHVWGRDTEYGWKIYCSVCKRQPGDVGEFGHSLGDLSFAPIFPKKDNIIKTLI